MIGKSQELKENEMHKAFKFRLLPTKEQEVLLSKHFGCSKCNTIHDRDVNASKNILRRALAIQSAGTVDYRNGDKVRPEGVSKASKGTVDEVLKKKSIRKYTLKPNDL